MTSKPGARRREPVTSTATVLVAAAFVVSGAVGIGQGLGLRLPSFPARPPAQVVRPTPDAEASPAREVAREEARDDVIAAAGKDRGQKYLDRIAPATMAEQRAVAAIAAVDLATGERIGWASPAFATSTPAYCASIVKVLISEAFLLHRADQGVAVTDAEGDLIAAALEISDNEAADSLFTTLEEEADLPALLHRLGLRGTTLDPEGMWGLTTTTVDDQLTVLQNLLRSDGPLDQAARTRILTSMGDVATDQDWGVGEAGKDPLVKNGWLDVDEENYVIDSIGIVTGPQGHRVAMVVLSHEWELQDEGIEVVGLLAGDLITALSR